MTWSESIANAPDREAAREKFEEWCEMKAGVHEEITFAGRQNDVARLHVRTDGNHHARDIAHRYGSGVCPIRCIDVNALDADHVELEMLLAELKVHDPRGPD